MKEYLNKVRAFQIASDQVTNMEPTNLSLEEMNLRFHLMEEENEEYRGASLENDKVELIDSLADQLYVLFGTINAHGMQNIIEEAFNRVHANNMTKIGPDGKVIRNAAGKILKGPNFVPVDLSDLV